MVLQSASIVFNDSASQFNKDLTDFLKRNLEVAIRKGNLSFQFKIAKPADLPALRQQGVKRLPAMIINSKPYVGVPDIIAEIRSRVKNSNHVAPEKSEDEIIREFQMASLGNVTKDADGKFQIHDEEELDQSQDLMSSFNREISRRGSSNGNNNEEDVSDRTRRQPAPSRNVDREHDDEDDVPRRRPAARQRPDNINPANAGDAFESLKSISRNATAEDIKDDEMMAALLGKLSE